MCNFVAIRAAASAADVAIRFAIDAIESGGGGGGDGTGAMVGTDTGDAPTMAERRTRGDADAVNEVPGEVRDRGAVGEDAAALKPPADEAASASDITMAEVLLPWRVAPQSSRGGSSDGNCSLVATGTNSGGDLARASTRVEMNSKADAPALIA